MAKGKGLVIRPCHVCKAPVNYVEWMDETKKRRFRVFHWANPDGSHHVHKSAFGKRESYADEYPQDQVDHLNSILREEF